MLRSGPMLLGALLLWGLPWRSLAADAEASVDPLSAYDDECAPGVGHCALNALQLSRARLGRSKGTSGCHTATTDDECFQEVLWAMNTGIKEHPEWYEGMTSSSSAEDFQWAVHASSPDRCPEPCGGTPREPVPVPVPEPAALPLPPPDPTACLCVFDIDRTLTARQGTAGKGGECPDALEVPGVEDNAYFGGDLTVSALMKEGLDKTFCDDCYLGLCSHGNANFIQSKERWELLNTFLRSKAQKKLHLKPENMQWSDEKILGPYIVYAPDEKKQLSVDKILQWYARQEIYIARGNTFFFDDRANNVAPFAGTGLNARQISCNSRDMEIGNGAVGFCGATPAEIVRQPGVVTCPEPPKPNETVASSDEAESAPK